MPWKRTTGSDGILAATGPPRSRRSARRASRVGVARTGRALLELARSSQLRHRPTREQLWLLTHLDGWAPATYRLDAAVNPLPPGLPTSRTGATACVSRTPAARSSRCRTAAASRCELTRR